MPSSRDPEARRCSECAAPLPAASRADAVTCSGTCRAARSRRLRYEARAALVQDAANGLDVRDAARAMLARGDAALR